MRTTPALPLDAEELEGYRRELTAYCYRMLGSGSDAEDAVQETMVKAWRSAAGFEGRSSVRAWLYRIATNTCLDSLRGRQRRARPMELGPSCPPVEASLRSVLAEEAWVSPIADRRILPVEADPADVATVRESVRLAFVAALQHLPARQRAALILCEVLRWPAAEVAELLDTSVASVNSALQRARATMATLDDGDGGRGGRRHRPADATNPDEQDVLVARYVDAFERYDVAELVTLLHADAVQSMPPFAMWLEGAEDIGAWMLGPGRECEGSRLVRTAANGGPAVAQYRRDADGGYAAWAVHVLELAGGRIAGIHSFLEIAPVFALFDLPARLPA